MAKNKMKETKKDLQKLLNTKYRKEAIKKLGLILSKEKTLKEMERTIHTLDLMIDIKIIKSLIKSIEDYEKGKFTTLKDLEY